MVLLILAVLVVVFIVETVLTEIEHWGWATLLLLLTAVGCQFLTPFHPVAFVQEHGVFTLVYALAYVGVGVAWSFVKWFSFLRGFRDTFRGLKETFCKGRSLDASQPVPQQHLPAFKDFLRDNTDWQMDSKMRNTLHNLERPRAANNKRRITAWMAYWPCSVIGTFLNDPVRRFFNWAFGQFKALYQKMSDYVFRKDLELK